MYFTNYYNINKIYLYISKKNKLEIKISNILLIFYSSLSSSSLYIAEK